MNNREWLYSLDVADLADWFDAEHAEQHERDERKAKAKSILNAESYKFASESDGESYTDCGFVENDSREKLEAGASELTADYAASGDVCDALYVGIVGLLDRQASITRREVLTQPDERDEQLAELTAQLYELTAERDALADDLLTCNKEREEYRELFSKAITHAHEIVNLQP